MNNSKVLFQEFLKQITLKDAHEENSSVAYLVFEHLFGLSRTDILSEKTIVETKTNRQKLHEIIQRINKNEPIQYILGQSEFYGRTFKVNHAVLIPRPETEELVRLIKDETYLKKEVTILDIGTGSGSISIILALEIPHAKIFATDISETALQVAKYNAASLHASVSLMKHDILNDEISNEGFDVIVSNPPYITLQEKSTMMKNVIDHEPHLALFVPDKEPLLFYEAIVSKAKHALKKNGLLAVEINEQYGEAIKQLYLAHGFIDVNIIKDLSGKDRIVKGILS